MEWSQDKTLQLIESYRLHPVLWDCKLSEYKLREKRYDAWNEIANSLNVEKDEVERKIKNLTSHFSRESKRVREEKIANTKSGSGASTYEGKWFAFKSMEFLLDRNKPRTTVNTEHPTNFFVPPWENY
ncbi:unnamed protein product [Macrosiphum euphorbiae]|uniref:MADF domain-containing protein n=1 Tax=Macrosiphum euphorbiae TaxID=13131 RepID=A0AAV0WAD8_9HEMI|nr:unnamed protein product [Macrosiphum euphorbiae]